MNPKRIVMVLPKKDFRDEEYQEPREYFEKQGYYVAVASTTKKTIPGMISLKIQADFLLREINPTEYDAVVFVGGSGSTEYWDHSLAHQIATTFYVQGKVVAAICLAPITLGRSGLLKGKKATVYSSAKEDLLQTGALYVTCGIQVTDRIVTANGPDHAKKFAIAIGKLLEH